MNYLPNWAPDEATMDALTVLMRPFNKRILHSTAYRQRVKKGTEDPSGEELHRPLSQLWESFLGALDDEQRGWFEREFHRV